MTNEVVHLVQDVLTGHDILPGPAVVAGENRSWHGPLLRTGRVRRPGVRVGGLRPGWARHSTQPSGWLRAPRRVPLPSVARWPNSSTNSIYPGFRSVRERMSLIARNRWSDGAIAQVPRDPAATLWQP